MTYEVQQVLDFVGRLPSVIGACDICREPILEDDSFGEKFNEHVTCFVAEMDRLKPVERQPEFE